MAEDYIHRRRELTQIAEDFLSANPSQHSVVVSDGGMSVRMPHRTEPTAESSIVVPEAESSSTPDERSAIEITDSVDIVTFQKIWKGRIGYKEGREELRNMILGFLMFSSFTNISSLSPEYGELAFLRNMLYEENHRDGSE